MILSLCSLAAATAASPAALTAPVALADEGSAPVPLAPPVEGVDARGFADHLLATGDPYNALTWYRLVLYQEPDAADADAIRFKIGLCYERGRRFDAAVHAYGQVSGGLEGRAMYRVGLSEHAAGRVEVGDAALDGILLFAPGDPWGQRAQYTAGVLALQRSDLDAARRRFEQVPGGDPLAARAATLAGEAAVPLSQKRPGLAMGLSVVPGLGQLYAGHPGDAAMAFVFNAALGLWSGSLLANGIQDEKPAQIVAGAALGSVFAVTWSANLLGAKRGAQRTNQHRALRRSQALLETAWVPELELAAEGVAVP